MIKCDIFIGLTLFCTLILTLGNSGYAQYLDEFPSQCAYASDREPLPGHIIRLGYVANSPYGWSFFFPDRRTSKTLERVNIIDNVGLIGQDPDEDFNDLIQARTPDGSFVVAQIFIANENQEPVVTCVSRIVPLTRYRPAYYGTSFVWLDRSTFGHWLKWRKYSKKWQWRKWWRKDFANIRKDFRGFKKYDRREPKNIRDDSKDRGRGLRQDNWKKQRNKPRPEKGDFRTKKRPSGAGMIKRDGKDNLRPSVTKRPMRQKGSKFRKE
jgi:hypothetical protein